MYPSRSRLPSRDSRASDASRTKANVNASMLPGLKESALQRPDPPFIPDQRPPDSIRRHFHLETTDSGDGLNCGSSSTRATSTSGSSEDSGKENRIESPFIPRSPKRPPTRARETLGSRGSYGSRGRNPLPPLVRQNAFRQRSPANTRRSRSPGRSNSPPPRSSVSRSSPRCLRLPSQGSDTNANNVDTALPPSEETHKGIEGKHSSTDTQSNDQPGMDIGTTKEDFLALSRQSDARSVSDVGSDISSMFEWGLPKRLKVPRCHWLSLEEYSLGMWGIDKVQKPFSKKEYDIEERLQTLRDNPALRAALEERVREFQKRSKSCNDVESNNKAQCWRTREEREERRRKNAEQGRNKASRARQKREEQERERLARLEMDVAKISLPRDDTLKEKKPTAQESEGKILRAREFLAFLSLTSKCRSMLEEIKRVTQRRAAASKIIQIWWRGYLVKREARRRHAAARKIQTFAMKALNRRRDQRKISASIIVKFLKDGQRRGLIRTLRSRQKAVSDASRRRELSEQRMTTIRAQWIAVENRVTEVLKKTSKPQKQRIHNSRGAIKGPIIGPPPKETSGCPSRTRVAKARKRLLLLVGSTGSGVASQTRDAVIASMERRVAAENACRIASFWKWKALTEKQNDTKRSPNLVSLRPTLTTLMKMMEEAVNQERAERGQ